MNSKLLLFDTDGTIKPNTLSRKYSVKRIDFKPIEDKVAKQVKTYKVANTIHKAIYDNEADFKLSFYGSGDFHHFTLFMLQHYKDPFYLVMFDHHYDVGSFRWRHKDHIEYHFGSWLYTAIQMKTCLGVLLVGPPEHWLTSRLQHIPYLKNNFNLKVIGEKVTNKLDLYNSLVDEIPKDCNIYITIDKDVLTEDDLITDWDAGSLTIKELFKMLQVLTDKCTDRIVGVDICGDPRRQDFLEEHELRKIYRDHLVFNQRIIKFFSNYLGE